MLLGVLMANLTGRRMSPDKLIRFNDLPKDFRALVELFPPRAIRDEVDYDNAQEVIDAMTGIAKLTAGQKEYLDTLSILFAAYEEEQHAVDTSDLTPVEVLRYLMEQHDMNASALGELLGERSLGSKILNGYRELSKSHIRKLVERFGVSADLFM